ncbi:antibiotic biosynthesis monooxygenase [Dyella sp. A6]|uniref:antibiotic biosynthesis monooxygenase family protein n=1 Tax=Dyella aluminiiresistens TaxID=3069105 RepID=UPI002E75C4AA|nr:antibiotic biosynthesis monooxygenase [Dyella sp. A6]
MFVAIYRWRLHPGLEQDFIANWQAITALGLAAGSGGSSLFRDADGCWVAIARWPSREARTAFFAQLAAEAIDPALGERARQAVIERFPDQELEPVRDMWSVLPGEVA